MWTVSKDITFYERTENAKLVMVWQTGGAGHGVIIWVLFSQTVHFEQLSLRYPE